MRDRQDDLQALADAAPALVAAADGTTNALSLRVGRRLSSRCTGPAALRASARIAAAASALPNLADDVDTMDDLERLEHRAGPHTRAAFARAAREPRVNVVVLSGGVGGARFVRGVVAVAGAASTTVIGNVGDDVEVLGLHVSPDLDSILYALAGLADEEPRLGTRRRDVARARDGARARRGGLVRARRPRPRTSPRPHAGAARRRAALGGHGAPRRRRSASRRASFRRPTTGCGRGSTRRPARSRSRSGSSRAGTATRSTRSASREPTTAQPAPGTLEALAAADLILIAPSNPYVSIHPILAVGALRDALATRRVPCVAVSPLIGGRAVKGPADRMLHRLAGGTSPRHVADCYKGLIDAMVVDEADADDLDGLGDVRPIVTRTLMSDDDARRRLAEVALGAVPA